MLDFAPLETLLDMDFGRVLSPPRTISWPVRLSSISGIARPTLPFCQFRDDRVVMGLLRSVCDAVLAGASELRSPPGHIWTADFIFPALSHEYRRIRETLGKPPYPLNVVVTASGRVDLALPLFRSGQVPVLVLTTPAGAGLLNRQADPASTQILALQASDFLHPQDILAAIAQASQAERILVEGGPHMIAGFFAEKLLDELFLTLTSSDRRPGRNYFPSRPGRGDQIRTRRPSLGKAGERQAGRPALILAVSFLN